MAYDESIAGRIRRVFSGRSDITEKKMMGGLAFAIGGGMCCYLSRKGFFLIRVTPEVRTQTLATTSVKPVKTAATKKAPAKKRVAKSTAGRR